MTYGEMLNLYLSEMGVSQAELARRIGTGRQTINGLVVGKDRKGPTLETAMAIADALGVTLQEMVDRMQKG